MQSSNKFRLKIKKLFQELQSKIDNSKPKAEIQQLEVSEANFVPKIVPAEEVVASGSLAKQPKTAGFG